MGRRLILLPLIIFLAISLGGCKGNQMTKEEVKQLQTGPPKEMPPQARAMLLRAQQQGGPPQAVRR